MVIKTARTTGWKILTQPTHFRGNALITLEGVVTCYRANGVLKSRYEILMSLVQNDRYIKLVNVGVNIKAH